MVRGRLLLLGASCCLLVALGRRHEPPAEPPPQDDLVLTEEEQALIEALQEVLEKLQNKRPPSSEKRLGWLPPCDAGEQCALRRGSRIGNLCGCPRGTVCNFSLLRCA